MKGNGTREKGRSEEGRERKKVRVTVVCALQTMCVPFFNILFHPRPPYLYNTPLSQIHSPPLFCACLSPSLSLSMAGLRQQQPMLAGLGLLQLTLSVFLLFPPSDALPGDTKRSSSTSVEVRKTQRHSGPSKLQVRKLWPPSAVCRRTYMT